jgi:hypothetical protein
MGAVRGPSAARLLLSQSNRQSWSRLQGRRWGGRQQAARRVEAEAAGDLGLASGKDEHQPSGRGRRTAASVGPSSGRRDSALGRRTSCAERAGAPRGEGAVEDHGGRRLLNVRAWGWQQAVADSEAEDRAAHLDRESTRPWRCWNRPIGIVTSAATGRALCHGCDRQRPEGGTRALQSARSETADLCAERRGRTAKRVRTRDDRSRHRTLVPRQRSGTI